MRAGYNVLVVPPKKAVYIQTIPENDEVLPIRLMVPTPVYPPAIEESPNTPALTEPGVSVVPTKAIMHTCAEFAVRHRNPTVTAALSHS